MITPKKANDVSRTYVRTRISLSCQLDMMNQEIHKIEIASIIRTVGIVIAILEWVSIQSDRMLDVLREKKNQGTHRDYFDVSPALCTS